MDVSSGAGEEVYHAGIHATKVLHAQEDLCLSAALGSPSEYFYLCNNSDECVLSL